MLPSAIPDHELLCLIGRGAYGEVWMARNAIGTLRAVKIVYRQSFQRVEHFEREFKGLLKFEPISRSHDGLVDILQIGRRDDAGYFFYVMELADAAHSPSTDAQASEAERVNPPYAAPKLVPPTSLDTYMPRTLRSELHQRGSLPSAECVNVGLKLATALQHLHSNGLVHRDIKPSNIIFVKGEPKLADIGLVTAIDDAQSLVGTAGYIPPEGPGTPQADIYSLGKVLYEIAFGKDRQDFPQLPPDLQSHRDYAALLELNEVILKACESDVRNRYPSAQEMQPDLALLQEGKSIKQARVREHRLGIVKKIALAAGLVASLALAISYWKPLHSGYRPKPEAKRLYDEGRWYYSKLTPEDHEKAFKYLSAAVEADPKFLQPYDELTILFGWARIPWVTNEQVRLEQTKKIEDKLLAIAPQSAERHTASSLRHFLERDWRTAEAEIVEAIRLKPDSAVAHDIYCFYLTMQGRIDEAKRIGQRAQELEPPYSLRVTALFASWPFLAERRFDLSIAQVQRVLELDKQFTSGYLYLGDCYEAQSNYSTAIDAYEKTADLWPEKDRPRVNAIFQALREALNSGGETGYFRKRIELAQADRALPESEQLLRNFSTWDTAGYYARLGENEKALDELTKYFNEVHVWQQIKFRPLYDTLRDEPRFKELVKRAGLEP
ncbi:MAG TPA: protein kinase [Verrucomicrobiae bacterium]|nr:protein kinase [Verrucomicrobiae bacterium]